MSGKVFFVSVILLRVFTLGLGHSLQWLFTPQISKVGRRWLMGISCFITNGLLVGLLLELGHMMFRVVTFWMVILLFVMYVTLAIFILYLLLRRFMAHQPLSRSLKLFAPLFVTGLLGLGMYSAYTPVIRHWAVFISRKMDKPLRTGVASGLYLGILFGTRQLDKLTGIMKQGQVDMVLLPGGLMGGTVDAHLKENTKPRLQKLTAPVGVYATLGNHDWFRDQRRIKHELEATSLTALANQVLEVNGVLLVGRSNDLDYGRPNAEQLLEGQSIRLPVLLMDHYPTSIEAYARLPIDVQVSGHVHNSQVALADLIVRTLYRLAYGYKAIGNDHLFTTSGYGFWGISLHLGSQSEVWVTDIKSKHRNRGINFRPSEFQTAFFMKIGKNIKIGL